MTFCCKLLALAAGLPVLAGAADPDMMNLVMPDASMVMEIDLAKIMASPIGESLKEGARQGFSTQLNTELAKAKPEYQAQLAALADIDWSREVQDIVIAGTLGKTSSALVIVRSSLDPARMQALAAFAGGARAYKGATILASPQPGGGVIAFLDNSIVLIGQKSDVESAIDRRGKPTVLPAALAAQVARYSGYDVWGAQTGIIKMPSTGPASAPAAGAKVAEYLSKFAGINAGLRFTPDFDLDADLEARTEKDASEIAEGLRWLNSSVQAQAQRTGKGGSGLEGLKYQVNGKRILLSLHVPEEKLRAGLQQMRTAQAAQAFQTGAAAGRRAARVGERRPRGKHRWCRLRAACRHRRPVRYGCSRRRWGRC
jgi:hypothetical protein